MASLHRHARDTLQKRQEEVAEKKRSPESLQIHYQDLRRGGAVETKGLSEFLIWARQEKVAIFTKEYYEYAIFNKPPAVKENVKFWCPLLETACMIPQNTAKEFYEFRNAVYVDSYTKQMYVDAVAQVISREKAFRMQISLISKESQPPTESQSELVELEAKEEELVEPEASASQPVESGSDFVEVEVEQIYAKDKELVFEPLERESDFLEVDQIDAKKKQLVKPLQIEDVAVKEDPEEKADVEGWKFVVKQTEKCVPLNALIMQLLTTVEGLRDETKELKQELKGLRDETKAVHKAISDNGESIVRLTMGVFLGKLGEKTNKEISIPIYGKKLPYVPFLPLEQLASLCLTSERKPRSTPLEAEIDILVKVSDKAASNRLFSPPRSQQQVLSTSFGFTMFIIGEITRSRSLCNDVYIHPSEAISSASSKLLYKFVQIERGLRACMDYYNVGQECFEGTYIVSPSFKNISSSDQLIDKVLAGRSVAFCNIYYLHANHKMWLVSV